MVAKSNKEKDISDIDLDGIRGKYNFYLREVEKTYGPKAKRVLELLLYYAEEGKKVSENKIAKILKEDVNEIRKILYLFQNQGFVFSKFWKINKKGWQINSWHVDFKNFEKIIKKPVVEKEKEEELSSYVCLSCNKYFSENEALEKNYSCECGEFLVNIKEQEYLLSRESKEEKIKDFVEDFI